MPCYLFGAYKKSDGISMPEIVHWSGEEINRQFKLKTPYIKRLRRLIKKHIIKPFLSTPKT